jgi:WD40 repeat protein
MSQSFRSEQLIECEVCHAVQVIDLKNYQNRVIACTQCASPFDLDDLIRQIKAEPDPPPQTPRIAHQVYVATIPTPKVKINPKTAIAVAGGTTCAGMLTLIFIPILILAVVVGAGVGIWESVSEELSLTSNSIDSAWRLNSHGGYATSLAYSPNGRYLASGGSDHTIRLWDLETGSSTLIIGSEYDIEDLAFSPSGELLASVDTNEIYVWSIPSGNPAGRDMDEIYNFTPRGVSFSPDGQFLAVADSDTVIYDVKTGAQKLVLEVPTIPDKILFSPDGKHIATLNWSGKPLLWDIETGLLLKTAPANGGSEASLSFSGDGNLLAYSGSDVIYIYNVQDDTLTTFEDDKMLSPRYAALSPDGKWLAVGDFFDKIYVWDVAGRSIEYELETGETINDVTFSPDGSSVSAALFDGTIETWILFEDQATYTSLVVTPDPSICLITADSDTQLFVEAGSDRLHRTLNQGRQAEADGQRSVNGVTWWHLRENAWARSDFVAEDENCASLPEL